MKKLYSVKLLFSSCAEPKGPESIFEEIVIFIEANNISEVEGLVYNHYDEMSYKNAEDGINTITLAKILDIYEIIDDMNFIGNINFKEAYSRYLIFEGEVSSEEIIERYYLDK